MWRENYDLENVVTPIDVTELQNLLAETCYDKSKTNSIINGFKHGFSLEYTGSRQQKLTAPNLPLTVGSELDLWNKVMKEVELGRFAGPYLEPPFKNFIQSPIGLVPKDGGRKTRLIFHLSYPRNSMRSVNSNTPQEKRSVHYKDFNDAVDLCFKILCHHKKCFLGKTDLVSAFRNLGIRPEDWPLLVMKARCPLDGKLYYFVDKCLPFGHAISCALFQMISDALEHIFRYKTKHEAINYLDDFLFGDGYKIWCDNQIKAFLTICNQINFPVSREKTEWGAECMVFLGLLINTMLRLVCVPVDKIGKGKRLIQFCLDKPSKKLTLLELQKVAGFLNFLCRAVVPGRVFTRRLYYSCVGLKKPHHHTRITADLRADLEMWLTFLSHPSAYCRPFFDFSADLKADKVNFYTDASRNFDLGAGGVCEQSWFYVQWDRTFMEENQPSIEYLELYAVAVGVLNWVHRYQNRRIILFCDNISVVYMINRSTSTCSHCLKLIRLIVLYGMRFNTRVFANYVNTKANALADSLSRLNFKKFERLSYDNMERKNTPIPRELWPMNKVW